MTEIPYVKIDWNYVRIEEKYSPYKRGANMQFEVFKPGTTELLAKEKFALLHANACPQCQHMVRLILWEPTYSPRRASLLRTFFKKDEMRWSMLPYAGYGHIVAAFDDGHGIDGDSCGHVLVAGPGQMLTLGLSDFFTKMKVWEWGSKVVPQFKDTQARVLELAKEAKESRVIAALMRDREKNGNADVYIVPDIVPAQKFGCGEVKEEHLIGFGHQTSGYNWGREGTLATLQYFAEILKAA